MPPSVPSYRLSPNWELLVVMLIPPFLLFLGFVLLDSQDQAWRGIDCSHPTSSPSVKSRWGPQGM